MSKKMFTTRKAKGGKILSFTKHGMDLLLNAQPWASRMLISKLLEFNNAILNFEQKSKFQELLKPVPESNHHQHLALKWLSSGLRMLDADVETILAVLDLSARQIFKKNSPPPKPFTLSVAGISAILVI